MFTLRVRAMYGQTMKLVAYLRVSSETQLEGFGLDVQEAGIKKWAKANGHTIVATFTDAGVSGAKDAVDRPGLTDVLSELANPPAADGMVVYRLDRLARALTVQEAVLALVWRDGGRVFTVEDGEVLEDDPDDPMRTAIRQMRGVFAQRVVARAVIVTLLPMPPSRSLCVVRSTFGPKVPATASLLPRSTLKG